MITVKAYAKVNLVLQVKPKRSDGYHEVKTLLQNIDLADTLTFGEADELSLHCDSQIKPEDNLVTKAALLLQDYANVSKGAEITLSKKIPAKAGLGGGSADAAATLLSLNKLWAIGLDKKVLFELGAKLGSDVNFFLDGGLAFGAGRGEVVRPLNTKLNLHMVIAKPNFGITAKDAYVLWDRHDSTQAADIEQLVAEIEQGSIDAKMFFNDLEAPVLEAHPDIKNLYEIGYQAGASLVMLSGSGSAMFAIVSKQAQDKVYNAWSELKGTVPRSIKRRTFPNELNVFKAKTIDRSIEEIET